MGSNAEKFSFAVKFDGGLEAKNHQMNLYDLSVALKGIHRSFTIIGNFIQTDQIITRVPDAKDISVVTTPLHKGSLLIYVTLILSGAVYVGSLTKQSVLGHLTWSCYDYLVKKMTGRGVDPDKSIFYNWYSEKGDPEPRIDSLIHKTESSLIEMHRPIFTESAASILITPPRDFSSLEFNANTYDAINNIIVYPDSTLFYGRTSSFNANTQTGMVYIDSEKRAVPFEFDKNALIDATFVARSLTL